MSEASKSPELPFEMLSPRYLGDAVVASFDGYQIWLSTLDGNDQKIALDPEVMRALSQYAADVKDFRLRLVQQEQRANGTTPSEA